MKLKNILLTSVLALATAAPALAQSKTWTADNGNGTFTNPLFYDEFSDPDIIRVGDDYYLAGTTMHTVPGLVILHSKDLVNWENVRYPQNPRWCAGYPDPPSAAPFRRFGCGQTARR